MVEELPDPAALAADPAGFHVSGLGIICGMVRPPDTRRGRDPAPEITSKAEEVVRDCKKDDRAKIVALYNFVS